MTDIFRLASHPVFETTTLGAMIEAIAALPPRGHEVVFDFCGAVPNVGGTRAIDSYRGWYEHLAMPWSAAGDPVADDLLLKALRDCRGKHFQGYKGGSYLMDDGTPLWVDNWGECTSTAIRGLEITSSRVIILTKWVDL